MIFQDNKYTKTYLALVEKRRASPLSKADDYAESHHVIPKSLGGSNRKDNLVLFTPREHFVAHLLLTKMTVGDAKRKMNFAFYSMRRGTKTMPRYTPNSHLFAIFAKNIKREFTAETRAKMSAAQKARPPMTEQTRQRLSEGGKASYTNNPALRELRSSMQKDRFFPDEHKKKLSESAVSRWSKGVPESHREAARQRRGSKSGRSKLWSILSPDNKCYLTEAAGDFCLEHGISYFALRNKAVTKDSSPVRRGDTKGWSVLFCKSKPS